MTLLEIQDLLVRYGDTAAVDGVSFEVEAGQIVGLLGANGAGKTTTIRSALGLERPTAGTVRLLGGPPSRRARTDVGYVPQSLGLWQDLSVSQNLAFVAAAYDVEPPVLGEDLAQLADRPVADLPLGQRRRIAFEAALCHAPRLLVLDEPTSGVGPLERTALWDRIHGARDAGAGVLVTTHHMSEAEQCERVIVLTAGRLVVSGTMGSLLDGKETVVVTTDDWAATFARLDAAFTAVAVQGRAIRVPDATVHDVRAALGALQAEIATAPSSFDEVFVTLARRA
jgi:ABC-type multidrug transport system ATPase subunit